MKFTHKDIAALSVTLAVFLSSCSGIAPLAPGKEQSWSFVESAGGIDVGRPFFDKNRMYLPVDFDPAGHTVTTRPTAFNSGLDCEPPRVRIQNWAVLITVRTTTAGSQTGLKSHCPPADLGKKIAPGHYDVFYLDPDGALYKIGAIFI